jgi:hypothetical protein
MSVGGLTGAFALLTAGIAAFTMIKWDGVDTTLSMFQKMARGGREEAQAHEDLKNNPLRESVTKKSMGLSDASR